jgi:hypothetical protein
MSTTRGVCRLFLPGYAGRSRAALRLCYMAHEEGLTERFAGFAVWSAPIPNPMDLAPLLCGAIFLAVLRSIGTTSRLREPLPSFVR